MKEVNLPKVRFLEYQASWRGMNLSSLVDFVDSGWSPQCDEGIASCGEWGVLKTTSVQWTGFKPEKNKKLPQALQPREAIALRKNDILVTRAGPNERVGVVSIVNKDYPKLMLSDKIIRLRATADTCPSFLTQNLSLKKSNYQIMRKASGLATSQTNISQRYLLQTTLNIPTLPEQQKIASFLSKVDKKIDLLTEKKDKLNEYKKGVMQQLFNGRITLDEQNTQAKKITFTSPTLRFKSDDGSEFPDWEISTIEKVAKLGKGFTPSTHNPENWGGGIPWLSIADMNRFNGEGVTSRTLSLQGAGNKPLVEAGTLIMSFKLTLGRLIILEHKAYTNEAICHFNWFEDKVVNKYAYYYLSSINIASFGAQAVKGITLNNDSLYSIVIKLPSIQEQTKIANFLTAIDQKIDLANSELKKAKEWKKGLLQQMFV
jgi:type I restriction enzyme S subunit